MYNTYKWRSLKVDNIINLLLWLSGMLRSCSRGRAEEGERDDLLKDRRPGTLEQSPNSDPRQWVGDNTN
jgi:hypothetical protein